MKKSDCSPEEWETYKAQQRAHYAANSEKVNERNRKYSSREDVKEARRARDNTPEAIARRRTYASSEKAKQRARERRLERLKENPEWRIRRNDYSRLLRSGFTREMYEAAMLRQGGACGVCRRAFSELVKPRADHCHSSLKPRGILCHQCNTAEGMIGATGIAADDFGKRLLQYLSDHA